MPAAVTTAFVIFASLGNGVQLDADWLAFAQVDKLKHGCAYFTLALLWCYAFRQNRLRAGLWLWLALFGMGAALEVLQWAFYPARYFEFADMLANGVGVAAGMSCFLYLTRTLTASKPHSHGY